MPSVTEHYANVLAPVYLWMVGGAEAAFAHGESDLAPILRKGSFAIDLGAGFGMHTIPLARAGWKVLAVDSSPLLLEQLSTLAAHLPVGVQCGDLVTFADRLPNGEHADLILCMGDTLTHLESPDAVVALATSVAAHLSPRGRFVATFRDYSRLPSGEARFIPVRADAQRILTCFLEEFDGYVQVHDLLHERTGDTWATKVGSYRKLRLLPEAVRQVFSAAGLRATIESAPRGMIRLVADA
jgi:SAM-dependent methyltransferase